MKILKNGKRSKLITAVLIVLIIVGICGSAIAASASASAWAEGTKRLELENGKFLIRSNTNMNTKNITIENTNNIVCYVRVKILAISDEQYTVKQNENWEYKEDGYWYYKNILNDNETVANLQIESNNEIIVIAESTEVRFRNDELYADWEKTYTQVQ